MRGPVSADGSSKRPLSPKLPPLHHAIFSPSPVSLGPSDALFLLLGFELSRGFLVAFARRYFRSHQVYGWRHTLDVDPAADPITPGREARQRGVSPLKQPSFSE